jgi:phosphatidate cytidylyltransferase
MGGLVGLKGNWVNWSAILCALIPLVANLHDEFLLLYILLTTLVSLLLLPSLGIVGSQTRIMHTLTGLIYPSAMLSCLIVIRNDFVFPNDSALLLFFIITDIWICDTTAYAGGKALGRHKLAPQVSPGKTWEGAFCGLIGAMIWAFPAWSLLRPAMTLGECMGVAIIVGVIGQIGDLAESVLKRSAGVKDTGSLLGPHGGILDRFDSLIAVAPAVYGYLMLVGKI